MSEHLGATPLPPFPPINPPPPPPPPPPVAVQEVFVMVPFPEVPFVPEVLAERVAEFIKEFEVRVPPFSLPSPVFRDVPPVPQPPAANIGVPKISTTVAAPPPPPVPPGLLLLLLGPVEPPPSAPLAP